MKELKNVEDLNLVDFLKRTSQGRNILRRFTALKILIACMEPGKTYRVIELADAIEESINVTTGLLCDLDNMGVVEREEHFELDKYQVAELQEMVNRGYEYDAQEYARVVPVYREIPYYRLVREVG